MDANDPLSGFSVEQRKWVIARIMASSDAGAARAIGIHPTTVCRWQNKEALDAAVSVMLEDPRKQVLAALADAMPKAARVKIAGLDSHNEALRQNAATDILDRGLGKPTQRQEVSGPEGGSIVVKWDDTAAPSNN